uniref:Sjogren syndrome nuclear autoantigen 1 n=2 Tax=Takifugu rubripes TaxID=31033 RepID=A0A3B5K7X8_TAKRU
MVRRTAIGSRFGSSCAASVPVHLRKEFTMTHQAAALQTYNNELIKVLDDLHSRREDLNRHIRQDEEEKEQLQQDSQVLSDKLRRVSENLSQRLAARAAFDRTIAETEAAYNMILESSQSLLCLLKKEAENLNKATDPRRKVH